MSLLPDPELPGNLEDPGDALDAVLAVAYGSERLQRLVTRPAPLHADQLVEAGQLGDFRIQRAIGRGGMGIVYEAEQISLGRRVALKVLPFAATLDPKQLQRFKDEARAAGQLHHTNIVPVYAVGCERGVHFYAMQFIEGQSLASLIRDLRRVDGRIGGSPEADSSCSRTEPDGNPAISDTKIAPATLKGTEGSIQGRAFFRTAAGLGMQAAQALEHAHQMGIIHRDIKPANLLVDSRSHLWITDFGLAHVKGETQLTASGDLLGTLRYMSPEQALARPSLIDSRTDIYSLGVTLYELLTLEPVFSGQDRQELFQQVAFAEPRAPQRLNRAIPAELATIVLKAMVKTAGDRYGTAQEMADDLQRFLDDKPILARRPTIWQHFRMWARRHRPAVWSATACLLLSSLIGVACAGWIARDRAGRAAILEERAHLALDDARELQAQAKWSQALDAVKRGEGILAGGGSNQLRERFQELHKDLEMVLRLEAIRMPRALGGREPNYDNVWADVAYTRAFRDYGIDVDSLDAGESAERIRGRSISLELTMALDEWASKRRKMPGANGPNYQRLIAATLAADPDEWRSQVRRAMDSGQSRTLNQLAASERISDLPLQTMALLANSEMMSPEACEKILRRAQQKYPDDFWINFKLAWVLDFREKSQPEEAIRFYTTALAIRPQNGPTHYFLGKALEHRGRLDEAVAVFSRAVELDPEDLSACEGLVHALQKQGKTFEAIQEYSRLVERLPESAEACNNLAWLLATCPDPQLRNPERALQLASRATELAPDEGSYWNTLGVAQYRSSHWEESRVALERSKASLGERFESYNTFFLALDCRQLGDQAAARRFYDQAVAWMEKKMPKNEELRRFRAEAAQLLGIPLK